MQYLYLSQDEQDDMLARALIDREKEHYHYELNRVNYESILTDMATSDLPAEWPDNIAKFKVLEGEALAAVLKGPDYDLAVKLKFRDRVQLLHATTKAEQSKVEQVHAAIDKALPAGGRRDASVARVQAAKGA